MTFHVSLPILDLKCICVGGKEKGSETLRRKRFTTVFANGPVVDGLDLGGDPRTCGFVAVKASRDDVRHADGTPCPLSGCMVSKSLKVISCAV